MTLLIPLSCNETVLFFEKLVAMVGDESGLASKEPSDLESPAQGQSICEPELTTK